jgi:hypothetical protein
MVISRSKKTLARTNQRHWKLLGNRTALRTSFHQPHPPLPVNNQVEKVYWKVRLAFVLPFSLPSLCELDIVLECSLPRHFNDELTLAIMRNGNFEILRLTKIALTKWKAIENIDLWVIFWKEFLMKLLKKVANATRSSHDDTGYMMLVVQSKDGGDEAFLAFTSDEIYAMACAEEGMPKTVVCLPYMRL